VHGGGLAQAIGQDALLLERRRRLAKRQRDSIARGRTILPEFQQARIGAANGGRDATGQAHGLEKDRRESKTPAPSRNGRHGARPCIGRQSEVPLPANRPGIDHRHTRH
jgi:hypothetical protein